MGLVRGCVVTAVLTALAALFVLLAGMSMKEGSIEDIVYSIQPHDVYGDDAIYYESLTKGKLLRQTVVADSSFNGIALEFHSDDAGKLSGMTYVKVQDSDGNVLHYSELENTKVNRDSLTYFLMDDGVAEPGTYVITVESDVAVQEQALDIYLENGNLYKGGLELNGEALDNRGLCLGVYAYTKLPKRLYAIIAVLGVAAVAAAIAAMRVFRNRLHYGFLVSALALGFVYMLLVAPGKGCDSDVHYLECYDYSNRLLLLGSVDSNDGLLMRRGDYEAYLRLFLSDDSYQTVMSKDGFMDVREAKELFITDGGLINTGLLMQRQNFVSYVPFILGLTLGRLLHLGAVPCMYLARVMGLVLYSLMIATAVRVMPICKEMLALVGLLPMNLHEYSAFSYDGMGIAAAYLFVACWLDCLLGKTEGRQRKVNFAIWVASAVLLGACKQGSFIFFLLLMVAVTKAYASWRERLLVAGGMAASAVVFNVVKYLVVLAESVGMVIIAGDGSQYMPGSAYTLDYGVHHPWKFLLMCMGSVLERFDYYLGSTLGTHLSVNTQMMPLGVVVPFLVVIILVSFKTEGCGKNGLGLRSKAALVLAVLANVGVLFFMMQVSTPVGWNIIGVTGRYFLPLLPMVFLLLHNSGVTVHADTKQKLMMGFLWWHIVEIFYAAWFILTR
jgi:uncharacterized membrane protein